MGLYVLVRVLSPLFSGVLLEHKLRIFEMIILNAKRKNDWVLSCVKKNMKTHDKTKQTRLHRD